MAVALVSTLTQDRVGLVSEIADHLFEAGVNLGDTTFAALGTGAEFTAVCHLPQELALQTLEQGLTQLPSLASAQVRVVPYMFDRDQTRRARSRTGSRSAAATSLGLWRACRMSSPSMGPTLCGWKPASCRRLRAACMSPASPCRSRRIGPAPVWQPWPTPQALWPR